MYKSIKLIMNSREKILNQLIIKFKLNENIE